MSSPLSTALAERRVLLCVGAGGVGKTTVSAALALRSATNGRRSLVCTIDPARRLANALGLTELGNTETQISQEQLGRANIRLRAPLFAMMLDMKRSWDAFIERHASGEQRDRILSNRLYQSISTRLAGSQEYIAMEKLWELERQGDYELVVLDTPPTVHALDFLDAPQRIGDFFDHDAARWLLTPALLAGKVGLQMLNLGGSFVAKTLARMTGAETLQELANLMLATRSLHATVRDRAKDVRELLAGRQTAFVLVTAPAAERLDEAVHFHSLLREQGMKLAAIVVNRVHQMPSDEERTLARRLPASTREKVLRTLDEATSAAEQDARGIAELGAKCGPTPLIQVPRFESDIHDLQGLARTAQYLAGDLTL
jgi:anion-transporting  ArsA/GET3 family ATPase